MELLSQPVRPDAEVPVSRSGSPSSFPACWPFMW